MNENQNEYVDINAHDNYPDSEQTIEIPTMKVIPLKKICMTIGELPTSYLETMTYYEMLIWFIEYLKNNIIPTINNNASAIQEVQSVVLALQNYINDYKDSIDSDVEELEEYMNNYFENLDVQDEINNKLDEMLEDGVLSEIIQQFLQSTAVWGFDTLADLQEATNLIDGSFARTLGYYSINDGGGALYKITDTESQTEYQETLSNNLYATLIIEDDTINFKQLGAKGNDNTYDNKNHLLTYVTICNNLNKKIKLLIPADKFYLSPTHIQRLDGISIVGIGAWNGGRGAKTSSFCAIDNQDYVLKFGGVADMENTSLPYESTMTGVYLENITFMSDRHQINYGALVLEYSNYGIYKNIFFREITGTGLYIRSSWENYFDVLNFRSIGDYTKPCLKLATIRGIPTLSANISAMSIDKLMFENISGDLIYAERTSYFTHCQIGEINVEYTYHTDNGESTSTITSETDISDYIPIYLFNGNCDNVTINNINWTGSGTKTTAVETSNGTYYLKSLFRFPPANSTITQADRCNLEVMNIMSKTFVQILESHDTYSTSLFYLDNLAITNPSATMNDTLFDVINGSNIKVNNYFLFNDLNSYKVPFNTINLYEYASNNTIISDSNTINKLGLALGVNGTNTAQNIVYPFVYDSTKHRMFNIRLKPTAQTQESYPGSYRFSIRGYVNGVETTKTFTDNNNLGEDWITITVPLDFDYGSRFRIMSARATMMFDTISYSHETSV